MATKFTAVVALTSLAVGLLGGSAFTHTARADYSAGPNGSCGTASPCLTESNTSSGPGVKSTSNRGNGLLATTKALGSTSTNGGSALVGQDLQATSGDGLFNFGVNGTSVNGTGVQGSGATAGVSGVNTSATGVGVLASSTNANGLLFEGSGKGVGTGKPVFTITPYGIMTLGDPTPGYGSGGITVNSYCGNSEPMFGGYDQHGFAMNIDGCGNLYTLGSVAGITSVQTNTVQGFNGNPVVVNPMLQASAGLSSEFGGYQGTNYTAMDDAGVTWLYQGYSTTSGKYSVEMGDSGSVYARIFITMLSPRVAQKTSTGSRVDTYTPQITQPTLEDFGEAQLSNGVADVALDTKFIAAIDNTTRYIVTLTPEGDCRGLYVAQRTPSGFTVRESQGGRSSIAFSYRIVAKPLGDNAARLATSALPYGFDHRVPPPAMRRPPQRGAVVPRSHTR